MQLDAYIFTIILLFLGAFTQDLGGLTFFGVSTNIILALLFTLSFYLDSFRQYLLLVLLGALSIRFYSFFSYQTVVLLAITLSFFWLRTTRFEPKPAFLIGFVIVGTMIFYILLDPTFFWYEFSRVFLEALYNSIFAFLMFYVVALYAKKN